MQQRNVILELTVRNHPGVMSHICGLFARRGFNVEKILCLPLKDGMLSRIWLQVAEGMRVEQLVSQLEKLEDVVHVNAHDYDRSVFDMLEGLFSNN